MKKVLGYLMMGGFFCILIGFISVEHGLLEAIAMMSMAIILTGIAVGAIFLMNS